MNKKSIILLGLLYYSIPLYAQASSSTYTAVDGASVVPTIAAVASAIAAVASVVVAIMTKSISKLHSRTVVRRLCTKCFCENLPYLWWNRSNIVFI